MKDINLKEAIQFQDSSNIAVLDEDLLTFDYVSDSSTWIFKDFDRIFDLVVAKLASNQTSYDIFGHSAGGQILHRFAIFHPNSKANNIIAGNSGFYTLPDKSIELPFGTKNTYINNENLKSSFAKNLVLLIGALDNADETGGTLLRSPTVDQQGLHRLERAKNFQVFARDFAQRNKFKFNWRLVKVPGVGHEHRKMAKAAATLLYEQ